MKKSHRWAILAVAVAVLSLDHLISLAVAQGPAGQPLAGSRIALLDVTRVFKNHARFKSMMDEMKAEVDRAEAQVKAQRAEIAKLAEQLPGFNKGTREYSQMEEELANRQAKLQVQVSLQKSDFLQKEAAIYYNVYQELSQVTDYFAKEHRIDMVIRLNSEPADPQKPETILAKINSQVVWYDSGLDITNAILAQLNARAVNPAAASRDGARPRTATVPFNGNR